MTIVSIRTPGEIDLSGERINFGDDTLFVEKFTRTQTKLEGFSRELTNMSGDLVTVAEGVSGNADQVAQDRQQVATDKAAVQQLRAETDQQRQLAESAVTAAAAQVEIATNQAGVAAAQAETATNQAGVAAAQAETATNQAGIAAASASEAAELTERYQGVLSGDPAIDKDGNQLTAGDWYINGMTGYIRVYAGSVWVQGISAVAGVTSINGQQGELMLKTVNNQSLIGSGDVQGAPDFLLMAQGII